MTTSRRNSRPTANTDGPNRLKRALKRLACPPVRCLYDSFSHSLQGKNTPSKPLKIAQKQFKVWITFCKHYKSSFRLKLCKNVTLTIEKRYLTSFSMRFRSFKISVFTLCFWLRLVIFAYMALWVFHTLITVLEKEHTLAEVYINLQILTYESADFTWFFGSTEVNYWNKETEPGWSTVECKDDCFKVIHLTWILFI